MNKYEVKIVEALLKKYYKRKAQYKDAKVNRRIDLPVNKVLKDYSSYNVNLIEKEQVDKAINSLKEYGYITASKLRYSEDFEKIYLCIDNIKFLEAYAEKHLNILPRSFAVDELNEIIEKYLHKGIITDYYIDTLKDVILNKTIELDVKKEEDLLKTLVFLEQNNEFLYTREASMLIFGDSKYLETNRKASLSNVLCNYFISKGEEVIEDENLLERFDIYDSDQDVCIKGPVVIELENKTIDIEGLIGGVSFSIKDINKIKRIIVNCNRVMAIENKTSFLRMNDDDCYIYLGGFATKPQIAFIKKLINDNPSKEYLHFGDIDAGGFWIHKKLCEQASFDFELFHMSKEDLENEKYISCLKELTENDVKRLKLLANDDKYALCIAYMLDNGIKLEQEIISYCIQKENTNA